MSINVKYVQQENPVSTKHEVLGELKITVEAPQYGDIPSFIEACGGDEKALRRLNGQVATDAKNVGRAYARGFEVPEGTKPEDYPALIAQITTKVQDLVRDYTPSAEDAGPSKAKKAKQFDEIERLVQSGEPLSMDKLRELLQAAR